MGCLEGARWAQPRVDPAAAVVLAGRLRDPGRACSPPPADRPHTPTCPCRALARAAATLRATAASYSTCAATAPRTSTPQPWRRRWAHERAAPLVFGLRGGGLRGAARAAAAGCAAQGGTWAAPPPVFPACRRLPGGVARPPLYAHPPTHLFVFDFRLLQAVEQVISALHVILGKDGSGRGKRKIKQARARGGCVGRWGETCGRAAWTAPVRSAPAAPPPQLRFSQPAHQRTPCRTPFPTAARQLLNASGLAANQCVAPPVLPLPTPTTNPPCALPRLHDNYFRPSSQPTCANKINPPPPPLYTAAAARQL